MQTNVKHHINKRNLENEAIISIDTEKAFEKTDHHSRHKLFTVASGGSVVKNPPANKGDTGPTPDLGGSHRPQSDQAYAPQLLNLSSRGQEPSYSVHGLQLLQPAHPLTHTPQ